jgi:excisionase family DNA binding protein
MTTTKPKAKNTRELLVELAESVADALDSASRESEFYDQRSSPLPTRTYTQLVRRGEVPGYKVKGRILVRRSDLHEYIERHRVAPRKVERPEDPSQAESEELDRLLGYENVRRAG